MAAGEEMLEVARAYEELAEVAGELARAVAEDRGSAPRPRERAALGLIEGQNPRPDE